MALPQIEDWSSDGRRALFARHETVIRALLENSFTDFADLSDLAPFGFRADDPVLEAVDWCVEAWTSDKRTYDPVRIRDRDLSLFSSSAWWLAQKVGGAAYRRIVIQQRQRRETTTETARLPGTASERVLNNARTQAMCESLGDTLRQLFERTCADLVTLWLNHTGRYRAAWFGWRHTPELAGQLADLSRGHRSKLTHDALFRFLCLHLRMLEDGTGPELAAVGMTMLSPCTNESPYRIPDRAVVGALATYGVTSPRHVGSLRSGGIRRLLKGVLDLLETSPAGWQARFRWVLVRLSVSATTVHVYRIEDGALRGRVDRLPALESLGSSDE